VLVPSDACLSSSSSLGERSPGVLVPWKDAIDGIREGLGVWIGVGTRMDRRWVGRGCAACVIVFLDGSKAETGIA